MRATVRKSNAVTNFGVILLVTLLQTYGGRFYRAGFLAQETNGLKTALKYDAHFFVWVEFLFWLGILFSPAK